MILEGSRYENTVVTRPVDHHGVPHPTAIMRTAPRTVPPHVTYVAALGDRLDYMAGQFLKDQGGWWRIVDANASMLFPEVEPGQTLRIPVL